MNRWTLVIGATLCLTLLMPVWLRAEIPEPDHVFWGKASYFGDDLTDGEVTVTVNDEPEILARYEVGSRPELGPQFVLRIPLDSTGPRLPGSARPGDLARFYINGEFSGEKSIGGRGAVTRLDIDPDAIVARVVSISDSEIVEGDAGTVEMVFTVTLSEAADFDIDVNYTTADGSATTADNDYVGENGVANLAAGDTETTLSITVNGDANIEPDETLAVNLTKTACSGSAGCTAPDIGDGLGTGSITDDDTPPSISVNDVTVTESDVTVQAIFRISLNHMWDQDVSVNFATADGAAAAGDDYLSNSGIATIVQGSLVTTVAVDVLTDGEDEDDETFFLDLSSPVGGTILDGRGMATILDDQNFLVYHGQQNNGTAGVQGLDGSWGVAASGDGNHLYAVSDTDSLAIFERDPATGDLLFAGVLDDGVDGIDGLDGARDVIVSQDGEHVYVVASGDDSVAVFARNTDDSDPAYGMLTSLQVIVEGQIQNALTVEGLVDATAVMLSPDPDGAGPEEGGTHVYVVGKAENDVPTVVGSLAVFERDTSTGELTYVEVEIDGVNDPGDFGPAVFGIAGASDVAISPEGAHVYVTGGATNSVAVFQRERDSTQPTQFGRLTYLETYTNGIGTPVVQGIEGASSVTLSRNGEQVYVTGRGTDGGVARFNRNDTDGHADFGELSFVSAVAATTGNGLVDAVHSSMSVDGQVLYTASFGSSSLSAFRRNGSGELEFIEVKKDGEGGVDGLFGATRLAVSPDDRQVFATGHFDDAVAIFVRDLDVPNDPISLASTSHLVDEWSNNPVVTLEWSGAIDVGHAGLEGYSVLFDTNPDTVPDAVVDVLHVADPHSFSSPTLAEGDSHYAHLRTCDQADNCTSTLHLGPFKLDLTAPGDPLIVTSDSHAIGVPSTDTRITMRWSGAIDGASGVAGYGITFTMVDPADPEPPPVPAPLCTQALTVAHTSGDIIAESAPLFNGRYFFHLCTQDMVGNWSVGVIPVGHYIVQSSDAVAPTVTVVGTVATTDDGVLLDGESVISTVTQLLMTFSEAMFDPADTLNVNAVRNPDNFSLFSVGLNGSFETVSCGPLGGDDDLIGVDEVFYDDITWTAALRLNGGFALPPESYRVIICDTLVDDSGNSLDGDFNGAAGGELVLDFDATSLNLLLNPNFDRGDLSFWIDTPEGTADVAPGVGVDIGGAFSSNTVFIDVIPASLGTVFGVSQCVPLTLPTQQFELSGWVWMAPDQPGFAPTAVGAVKFFTGDECDVAPTGSEQETNMIVGDTGGFWQKLLTNGTAPFDAASVLVSFVIDRSDAPPDPETLDGYFDDLYFGTRTIVDVPLFADGFEDGTTDAWSAVTP